MRLQLPVLTISEFKKFQKISYPDRLVEILYIICLFYYTLILGFRKLCKHNILQSLTLYKRTNIPIRILLVSHSFF